MMNIRCKTIGIAAVFFIGGMLSHMPIADAMEVTAREGQPVQRDGSQQASGWDETKAILTKTLTWEEGGVQKSAVRIQSQTFTPPTKPHQFRFKQFGNYKQSPKPRNNFPHREYVDYKAPSLTNLPVAQGVIADAEPDSATRVRVVTLVTTVESAAEFPVWAEGNLEYDKNSGGQGTTSTEYHWGARIGGGEYYVYLTFDDGPRYGTDDCIGVLKEEEVPGTFFMIGMHMDFAWARKQVKAAYQAGHLLGNHSNEAHATYPYTSQTVSWWLNDFQQCDTLLTQHSGAPAGSKFKHSRLPGRNTWRVGSINATDGDSGPVANHLATNGYVIYGWDGEYFRNHSQTPQQVADSIVAKLQAGTTKTPKHFILLMHDDQFRKSQGNRAKLKELIQQLKNNGANLDITFLTVEDYPQ